MIGTFKELVYHCPHFSEELLVNCQGTPGFLEYSLKTKGVLNMEALDRFVVLF